MQCRNCKNFSLKKPIKVKNGITYGHCLPLGDEKESPLVQADDMCRVPHLAIEKEN